LQAPFPRGAVRRRERCSPSLPFEGCGGRIAREQRERVRVVPISKPAERGAVDGGKRGEGHRAPTSLEGFNPVPGNRPSKVRSARREEVQDPRDQSEERREEGESPVRPMSVNRPMMIPKTT